MKNGLTIAIALAMLLGIGAGLVLHANGGEAWVAQVSHMLNAVTTIFLRLIKMIIAPLVLSTLVAGIAHMEDTTSLGRIGLRTMAWFLCASIVSLFLGLFAVTLFQPGANITMALPTGSAQLAASGGFTLDSFITHLVPESIFSAMAGNEILQIVIFSLFAGVALTAMGSAAKPLVRGLDIVSNMMLKITGYVMWAAPPAVFAAVAGAVSTQGIKILFVYGQFVGSFYAALIMLWTLIMLAGFCVVGKRIFALPQHIRQPLVLAFSTASSEAALGPTLSGLERFGVPRRIGGFVLPLGYSFNLDGSMMYCTFAAIFIAQAYGIELSWASQLAMLAMFLVTSKGIAGVPRASLVVLAATLPHFGIPEAGLLLILGVDHFLDMGRTATNVVGNAVAAAAVNKWESRRVGVADADTPDAELPAETKRDIPTPPNHRPVEELV